MNNKLNLLLSTIIGILFSVLFLWKTPGISSLIFFLVVVCFAFILVATKKSKKKINTLGFILLPFVLVLASSSLFRADITPRVFSLLALIFAQTLFLAIVFTPSSLTNFGLIHLITTPLKLSIAWIPDTFNSLKALFKTNEDRKINPQLKKVLIGLVISIPILFVVLALLSAADAVFAKYFTDILQNTLGNIFKDFWSFIDFGFKVCVSIFVTLYYVALNWGLSNENSTLYKWLKQEKSDKEFNRNWDITITSTVYVLLNITFALFLFVQFKYLFGGQENILKVDSSFTYAQYARKGFWELLAVAFFVYMIQLLINGKVVLNSVRNKVLFYVNSILVSLFVLAITFSAERRLSLYEEAYGYTALRLFVDYVIYVIAFLFIALIISNFGKNLKAITSKLLAVVFSVTIFLMLVFPFDYATSLLNVNRYKETKQIDYGYLFSLSNEALPNILSLYKSTKDPFEKDMLRSELQSRLAELEDADKKWQEFNIFNSTYKKNLKDELNGYKITSGITEELDKFLNDYEETMTKGDFETAYNMFWSKSTNKSDFIKDAKEQGLNIYKIRYAIPSGVNNIDNWKKNSVTPNRLTLYIPYAATYGYSGNFINFDTEANTTYPDYFYDTYSPSWKELKVIIENNEIRIISDYTFQLGENMTNYGTSYYMENTYTR